MVALLYLIVLVAIAGVIIYKEIYFNSVSFKTIKNNIASYISDCNALNEHIEELRSSNIDMHKTDYGEATYSNISRYKYNKQRFSSAKYAPNIYDCSRQVCDNARKQPFKYICKYFNIKENEESLQQFEGILNNFMAAEEGKKLSQAKRDQILNDIAHEIPWIIRTLFKGQLTQKLGFEPFRFNELYFPSFTFRYISSGGKSGNQFKITLDISMMERFITYLSEKVKFNKSQYLERSDKYSCLESIN